MDERKEGGGMGVWMDKWVNCRREVWMKGRMDKLVKGGTDE